MKNTFALFCLFLSYTLIAAAEPEAAPVTPDASNEALALLHLLYATSGKYMLTGQHNYPNTKDRNTQFAKFYSGKTPAVYSIDMGHAREGDTDSYLARPDIVKECIRQHNLGSLITICWHAVPPTADEPVTFRPLPGTHPDTLKSVQGQLLDQQFEDILTTGTALYAQWCKQVDSVAVYLKELDIAGVPVLWRPYHEMNGAWFWWGGRTGDHSTKDLYIQLFERLVNHHKLKNLVWVWSVDRFHNPEMHYAQYYPGNEYVDILSLDVYGSDFKKEYYDSLKFLAEGKPLALAEVGNPPKPEILDEQPDWTFYAIWAGMVRNTLKKEYDILLNDPRIISQEDSLYPEIMNPYRQSIGLPPLPLKQERPIDLTGSWIFCETASKLDGSGSSRVPSKLNVIHNDTVIEISRISIEEYASIITEEEAYSIDGREYESSFWNSPRITTVSFSDDKGAVIFSSTTTFIRGDDVTQLTSKEFWTITHEGNLSVHQVAESPWGNRDVVLVYNREWK